MYVALRKRYRRNIRNATAILRGNIRAGKALLSRKMRQFSEKKAYEQAAKVRDTIRGLDGLIVRFHAPESYLSNPILAGVSGRGENRELESILRPTFPSLTRISRIECYDISNISGTLATGSLVTCVDGVPKKEFYRRFRIKTKKTPDDFAMLQEVFTRRLKHTEWQLPDLIIIDGGIPQLTACGKIFQEKDMRIPYIGIAKEYEKLVIPQGRQFRTLLLPQNSPALQAVQRIRDEAHRFAHAYHQTLRRKNLFQSFEKKRKV